MQISNPYGAVPNALKDTRLTLRDIGADLAAEKNAANQMELAVSEQDIRRAKSMSDIETDKQRRAAAAAQLYGQNLQNQQLARTIQEQNKVVTAEEIANRAPGGKYLLPLFGIDPKEKRTVAEWTPMVQQVAAVLQKSPYVAFQGSQYVLKGEIDELLNKINTPGLDDATKKQLTDQVNKKMFLYTHNDRLGNAIQTPTVDELGARYDRTAALKEMFESREQYIDSALQTHQAVRGDARNMQKRLATADIDPNYDKTLDDALGIIATKMTNKKQADSILGDISKKLDNKDYAGAYNLAKSWAEKLGAPAGTPAAPGTPPPAVQQPWNTWDRK